MLCLQDSPAVLNGEDDGYSSKTFYFNNLTNQWIKGPALKGVKGEWYYDHRRSAHTSGIVIDKVTKEKMLIAVGGCSQQFCEACSGKYFDICDGDLTPEDVIILKNGATEWLSGPNIDNSYHGIYGHSMVHLNGDLIISGGSNVNTYGRGRGSALLDELNKFSCFNNVCTWTKLQQKLKIPRSFHVAIAVPDHILNCI